MEKLSIIPISEWRSAVYRFLSQIYRFGLNTGILDEIAGQQLLTKLFYPTQDEAILRCCKLIEREVYPESSDNKYYLELLEQDYHRLFLGPGHLLAPPWESVYRTKERILFSEYTLAVREFYRSFGLESITNQFEPDDHIGLELEFMAHIGVESKECLEKQRLFIAEHLLKWVPDFCQDIKQNAETRFFKEFAQITVKWLEFDWATINRIDNG